MKTGYVIFAHGSRLESANDQVRAVAREVALLGAFETVDVAFLDCAPPDLATTIERLVALGVERVVVVPYFLTLGRHTAEDLPRIAAEVSRIHKNVRVDIADPMDGHPALAQVLLERARSVTK